MIRTATLAPASFVVANMRQQDRDEVMCQVAPGTRTWEIAYGMLMGSDAWVAYDKQDRAACFFGVSPINVAALSVWAIGTRHMWRTVAEVSKFLVTEVMPHKIEQGYRSMEARSLLGHSQAHKWMEELGGKRTGEPFEFGSGGELFVQYRWTRHDFAAIRAQSRYRSTTHLEHA